MYTPEDYYGTNTSTSATFPWGNHTSCAIRITVCDTSFLVLGDVENTLCAQMATNYKDALKSDIMQTTHHGVNGGELSFYQYVDPQTVLWTIDEFRFENDARCLGVTAGTEATDTASFGKYIPVGGDKENSSYNFNYWLRNNGSRTHIPVSTTRDTRIFCMDPDDLVIVLPSMPLTNVGTNPSTGWSNMKY